MKEFTCIICPRGCRLTVDDNMNVTGNTCPRGKQYAISELTNPVRTITSSVRVNNRDDLLVSVKTSGSIPKTVLVLVEPKLAPQLLFLSQYILRIGELFPTHILIQPLTDGV